MVFTRDAGNNTLWLLKEEYTMLGKKVEKMNIHFFFLVEKEMATHSSILAWRIPWTEEPGGLKSMGSQRVGHD